MGVGAAMERMMDKGVSAGLTRRQFGLAIMGAAATTMLPAPPPTRDPWLSIFGAYRARPLGDTLIPTGCALHVQPPELVDLRRKFLSESRARKEEV